MNADERPITVDLARETDFALGAATIRPSLRQVEAGGGSDTLEPRVMQVLVALARRKGEVVSRDELIAACWGGRIVGEDAITRSVNRVRRVGEATGAFSLETIPRVGYRLLEAAAGNGLNAEAVAAEGVASGGAAGPPELTQSSSFGQRQQRLVWAGAGALAVLAVIAVLAWNMASTRQDVDVDRVVARLSDQLRADAAARPGDLQQAQLALEELGDSSRPEEKSAFAALVSNDGKHALDILEDLARQLEISGDRKAASAAWRRLGALAVTEDRGRGVLAQRRSFELDPGSLSAFQNLFFVSTLKSPQESIAFADHVLEDPGLSDRMRGWVLSNRAFAQIDWMGDVEAGAATLAQMKALPGFSGDAALQPPAMWVEALLAFNGGDLRAARELAARGTAAWVDVPEKTSNSAEVMLLRMMFEQGDWAGMFAQGSGAFDRRAREGDLLPGVITAQLCDAGWLTGQAERALAYCRSSAHRGEGHPAVLRSHAAMVTAIEGGAAPASREFERAHAMAPPAGSIPGMVLIYEALAASRGSGLAEAKRILSQPPAGQAWEQATQRRRSVLAMQRRLHGQWLIAAGDPARACAPLAEAERVYDAIGGDPGRDAVRVMQTAAGCG